MFGMIGQDTNWRVQKNNYTKKIKVAFKVVQIKFNAYYQSKIKFYIFTVGDLHYIFLKHDLYLIS